MTAAADAAVSYITMFYWTSLCPSLAECFSTQELNNKLCYNCSVIVVTLNQFILQSFYIIGLLSLDYSSYVYKFILLLDNVQ